MYNIIESVVPSRPIQVMKPSLVVKSKESSKLKSGSCPDQTNNAIAKNNPILVTPHQRI